MLYNCKLSVLRIVTRRYNCLQRITISYLKPCNCANKWLLVNWNNYFKQYNYLYYLGILEAIQLCTNYLYLIGILDIIELCAKIITQKMYIWTCNERDSPTSRHNITFGLSCCWNQSIVISFLVFWKFQLVVIKSFIILHFVAIVFTFCRHWTRDISGTYCLLEGQKLENKEKYRARYAERLSKCEFNRRTEMKKPTRYEGQDMQNGYQKASVIDGKKWRDQREMKGYICRMGIRVLEQ